MKLDTLVRLMDFLAWIGPIVMVCLIGLICFALVTALIILAVKAVSSSADTKPARPIRAKPDPILNAVANVCLLTVLYLIFFTDNWPLVVLFALIGLAFSKAARP